MRSVSGVIWIGNAAAVFCGRWGAVSRRAHEVGCRREAMYKQARRVEQDVAREQASGPLYDEVLAAHQRLRAENQALWEDWDAAEALPEARQRALTATAAAMGLRLTQIVVLLAIVLSPCRVPNGHSCRTDHDGLGPISRRGAPPWPGVGAATAQRRPQRAGR